MPKIHIADAWVSDISNLHNLCQFRVLQPTDNSRLNSLVQQVDAKHICASAQREYLIEMQFVSARYFTCSRVCFRGIPRANGNGGGNNLPPRLPSTDEGQYTTKLAEVYVFCYSSSWGQHIYRLVLCNRHLARVWSRGVSHGA